MTDMIIALQAVKVAELKRAWDAACAKYDWTETWYNLVVMNDARRALTAAEDELLAMKEAERYNPYAATNVRPYDAEREDYLDCKYAERN